MIITPDDRARVGSLYRVKSDTPVVNSRTDRVGGDRQSQRREVLCDGNTIHRALSAIASAAQLSTSNWPDHSLPSILSIALLMSIFDDFGEIRRLGRQFDCFG
jgi:hypothetical protein